MYRGRSLLLQLLLTTFLLACSWRAHAGHTLNYYLTYRCLANNSYEITLHSFRQCSGLPTASSAAVAFASTSGGCNGFSAVLLKQKTQEISPVCASQLNTLGCNGTQQFGYEETIYTGTVTLTGTQLACTWKVTHDVCCYNPTISNILGPGQTSIYIEAQLTNSNGICNNSPEFTKTPVIYHCQGEPFVFNPGTYDIDGDSLTYELVSLQNSGGANVTYQSNLSGTSPFPSSTAIKFDGTTGTISGTPNTIGSYPFQIKVKEYHCNTKAYFSYNQIHVHLIVVGCAGDSVPVIQGGGYDSIYQGTAIDSNSFFVNPGDTLRFDMLATDGNPGDIIHWKTEGLTFPPNANLNIAGTNPSTATFEWHTTATNVGHYQFTIAVYNYNCPAMVYNVYGFEIWVGYPGFAGGTSPSLSATYTAPTGPGPNTASIDLTVSGSGPFNYLWSNGDNVQDLTGIPGGEYKVIVKTGGCNSSLTIDVPACYADATIDPDSIVCTSNQVLTAPPGNDSYTWNTGDTSQMISIANAGTYWVTVTDSFGCVSNDTVTISIVSATQVSLGPDTILCKVSNYLVDAGSGFVSYSWSPTISGSQFGNVTTTGSYEVTVVDLKGCMSKDTINVTLELSNGINMGPDKFVCPGDSAYLFGPPGYSYSWSTGSSQQGIWVPLGSYNLVVTTGNGCQSSDSINVLPKFIAKPNLGPDTAICVGSNILLVAPGGYSTYQWTGGPSAASWLVGPGTYELEVGDANLCKAKDTIVVSTTSQPAFLGNDTTLCTSDTLIISPGLNYASYTWCGGDTTVYDTITQAGMYCVFTVDTNGCTSSDSIFVTYSSVTANFSYSKNNLAISFSPLDTNAATYLWNFGDSTATSSVMNPNHQYAQAGIYHVCLTVIDSAGCSKTTCDSVIVGNVAATSMLFDQISLYPNPTTGIVYFYSTKTFPKTLKWTVFDGTGREIQNADWDGKEELLIDLSDRSSGIYYLRIEGFNKAFRIQLD